MSTERISPTAHYTGTTWLRHGLGDARLDGALDTWRYDLAQPLMRLGRRLNRGVGADEALLQRHRILDHLLATEIAAGRIGQVVEVPCGLSARGLRFCDRFSDLRYIEADLPHMVARKRSMGIGSARHEVVAVDLLQQGGPGSLPGLLDSLDASIGTAVVMEGMLYYFDEQSVLGIWNRTAAGLSRFPVGLYLADTILGSMVRDHRLARWFLGAIAVVARGRLHVHFDDVEAAVEAMAGAGFTAPRMHVAADFPSLGLPATHRPAALGVLAA